MPKITIIKIIHFTIDFLLAGFYINNLLRRLRNAKHRINTVFFVVKIKYLLKVYGKIELTRN